MIPYPDFQSEAHLCANPPALAGGSLEEYKVMRKKHLENYDSFIQKLGSPLDKEFIKIMDEQLDTLPLDFFQMFSDGFKLGAKMMIEVLGGEGEKEINE